MKGKSWNEIKEEDTVPPTEQSKEQGLVAKAKENAKKILAKVDTSTFKDEVEKLDISTDWYLINQLLIDGIVKAVPQDKRDILIKVMREKNNALQSNKNQDQDIINVLSMIDDSDERNSRLNFEQKVIVETIAESINSSKDTGYNFQDKETNDALIEEFGGKFTSSEKGAKFLAALDKKIAGEKVDNKTALETLKNEFVRKNPKAGLVAEKNATKAEEAKAKETPAAGAEKAKAEQQSAAATAPETQQIPLTQMEHEDPSNNGAAGGGKGPRRRAFNQDEYGSEVTVKRVQKDESKQKKGVFSSLTNPVSSNSFQKTNSKVQSYIVNLPKTDEDILKKTAPICADLKKVFSDDELLMRYVRIEPNTSDFKKGLYEVKQQFLEVQKNLHKMQTTDGDNQKDAKKIQLNGDLKEAFSKIAGAKPEKRASEFKKLNPYLQYSLMSIYHNPKNMEITVQDYNNRRLFNKLEANDFRTEFKESVLDKLLPNSSSPPTEEQNYFKTLSDGALKEYQEARVKLWTSRLSDEDAQIQILNKYRKVKSTASDDDKNSANADNKKISDVLESIILNRTLEENNRLIKKLACLEQSLLSEALQQKVIEAYGEDYNKPEKIMENLVAGFMHQVDDKNLAPNTPFTPFEKYITSENAEEFLGEIQNKLNQLKNEVAKIEEKAKQEPAAAQQQPAPAAQQPDNTIELNNKKAQIKKFNALLMQLKNNNPAFNEAYEKKSLHPSKIQVEGFTRLGFRFKTVDTTQSPPAAAVKATELTLSGSSKLLFRDIGLKPNEVSRGTGTLKNESGADVEAIIEKSHRGIVTNKTEDTDKLTPEAKWELAFAMASSFIQTRVPGEPIVIAQEGELDKELAKQICAALVHLDPETKGLITVEGLSASTVNEAENLLSSNSPKDLGDALKSTMKIGHDEVMQEMTGARLGK